MMQYFTAADQQHRGIKDEIMVERSIDCTALLGCEGDPGKFSRVFFVNFLFTIMCHSHDVAVNNGKMYKKGKRDPGS